MNGARRFPDEVIAAVIDATDLQALVEQSGMQLRSQHGRRIGWCPWCQKPRTPAFAVYRDHYYCHRCEVRGSAFDWLMNTQGMTFREAVEYLASLAGISLTTAKVSRVAKAAADDDLAACRWWWQRRWEATRAALDELMAEGPPEDPDDEWGACVSRMLRYLETTPPAERLRMFRMEVTGADLDAWRKHTAEEKTFAAMWMSLAAEPFTEGVTALAD